MTADEIDALLSQFTDEELLAGLANRYRSIVVCMVKSDPLARPTARVCATSALEAQVLAASLVGHVHMISQGKVPPNDPPSALRTET